MHVRLGSSSLLCALFAGTLLAAGAPIPRSEVPEPQFARTAWQTLNGPWDFAFDDSDTGLAQHWYRTGLPSLAISKCPTVLKAN